MTIFNALMREEIKIDKRVSERLHKETIPCTCGKIPYLIDTPTLEGRQQSFLKCNCGETGVIIFDGERNADMTLYMVIEGWNERKWLNEKFISIR
jgi:hypothetical protein